MRHKHHIVPRYRGGSDDPSNLVDVSINQHIMFHFCEYQLHGDIRDKLAYKGLSGKDDEREELLREMSMGRFWVTNGTENKLLDRGTEIPYNWKKGRVMDPQIGKKIGDRHRGRKQSAEWIKKRLDATAETNSKEFIVIPPDGDPYTYKGKRNFCREKGWPIKSGEVRINEVIKGKRRIYKGYKFMN